MNQILAEIIDRFIDEYEQSSGKMKVLALLTPALLIFAIFFLVFRGCSSGPTHADILEKQLGFTKLTKTDDIGDKWEIDLIRNQKLSDINKEAQYGEPLWATLDVKPKDKALTIGLNVTGQANEKYVGGARKNGKWQEPPTINIYTSGGKKIHTGKFEYG